jgi:hypothetical protein
VIRSYPVCQPDMEGDCPNCGGLVEPGNVAWEVDDDEVGCYQSTFCTRRCAGVWLNRKRLDKLAPVGADTPDYLSPMRKER